MIEDKTIGLKMPENEEEKRWFSFLSMRKAHNAQLEQQIKEQEKTLKMKDREIVQKVRAGSKETIRQLKETFEINKELIKFADGKLK